MIVRRAVSALALSVVLVGCTSSGSSVPSPSAPAASSGTDSTPSLVEVRRTLAALVAAVDRDDRDAFRAQTSTLDPAFANRVRLLFDNLTGIDLDRLSFRPDPSMMPLTGARGALFGGRGWRQPVHVDWRLSGESAPSAHTVSMTFVADPDGVRLAGVIDESDTSGPQPLWWLTPVVAQRTDHVIVLAAAGQSAQRWSGRAVSAARTIARELPAPLDRSSTAVATLEVPTTVAQFERLLGAAPGTRAGVAAVAQLDGSDDRAAIRVIVNPRSVEALSERQLIRVLGHEFVHVATSSPRSAAPRWAVEGLAEWVSLRATPKAQSDDTAGFLARVRRSGAPRTPPEDADFRTSGTEQRLAYAQAWLLCRYIADRESPGRLGELYAALDRGDSLDEASRAVLGRSQGQLITGWRSYLTRLAER